jgi:predicted AAA+ superfamily ATPase
MVQRTLDLEKSLGAQNSAFLFGARGVGKTYLASAYVKNNPHCKRYDLLKFSVYSRYLKDPSLLSLEIEAEVSRGHRVLVWVDEVQKIPALLDEVHSLIESHKGRVRFLLTGSSARKLKRSGANLLAGRALSLHLYPLTYEEFPMPLSRCLRLGSLPGVVVGQDKPEATLRSYIATYLKEEILEEALARKVDAFARFLEIAAQYHGEPINASEIGKAAGVSGKTVNQYFQILEDTLIGWKLPGWSASTRKQLRTTPKFFLFDNGVANALRGELNLDLQESSSRFGKLFECWAVQELFRLNDYYGLDLKFSYWQTNTGTEVDIIISRGAGPPIAAVELKSSKNPEAKKLNGLKAFSEEYPKTPLFCFCRSPQAYSLSGVTIHPIETMLEVLKNL